MGEENGCGMKNGLGKVTGGEEGDEKALKRPTWRQTNLSRGSVYILAYYRTLLHPLLV